MEAQTPCFELAMKACPLIGPGPNSSSTFSRGSSNDFKKFSNMAAAKRDIADWSSSIVPSTIFLNLSGMGAPYILSSGEIPSGVQGILRYQILDSASNWFSDILNVVCW